MGFETARLPESNMLLRLSSLVLLACVACTGGAQAGGDPPEPPVGPVLVFEPAMLSLGPVATNGTASVDVSLRNVGDTPATGLASSLRGDAGFSFVQPVPSALGPNQSLGLSITYRPTSEGTHRATLTAHGETGISATLPVAGTAQAPRVSFSPAILDFGDGDPSCGPRERAVVLENLSSFDVVLEGVSIVGGEGRFALRDGPEPGLALGPGETCELRLAFAGGGEGRYEAALSVRLGGSEAPALLPLEARIEPMFPETVLVPAPPSPRVGVLVVIDNDPGMAGLGSRLQDNLRTLWSFMRSFAGRIAVTTTSLSGADGCGGEDGRFVPLDGSRPRILFLPRHDQEGTPDGDELLVRNADVGTCAADSPQGLEAARRALTDPLATSADDPRHPAPADGNLGFLFEPSDYYYLELVFISNRDDVSPESDARYRALLAVGGPRNGLGIHVIAGDPGTGCVRADGFSAAPGDRLAGIGDSFASICEDDWFDEPIFPFFECWPLGCIDLPVPPRDLDGNGVVDDADIEVSIGGRPVPAVDSTGRELWTYVASANTVCLGYLAEPRCEADLSITFTPACP